jgi:hypothetical protein
MRGVMRSARQKKFALESGLSGKLAVGNGLRRLLEEIKRPGIAAPSI